MSLIEIPGTEDVTVGMDRSQPSMVGRCPFCGLTWAAGYSGPMGREGTVFHIGHEQPACPRFIVDAVVFLRVVSQGDHHTLEQHDRARAANGPVKL